MLTEDVQSGLRTAECNARRDVGCNTSQRPRVLVTINPRYTQVTAVLPAPRSVGQRLVVQGPVERDLVPVGDVAPQTDAGALDDVLTDWSGVKVEAILLARPCNH